MSKIILITGGTSSGKSKFAEEYCSKLDGKTAYIATSLIFDEEMEIKKNKHVKRRESKNWETIEEDKDISTIINSEKFKYDVVLVDCITMYITNLMFNENLNFDAKIITEKENLRVSIFENIRCMINSMKFYKNKSDAYFILVTNEIGMGVLPANELSRFFAEISGEVNQILSSISDEVYLTVSGIPIQIK